MSNDDTGIWGALSNQSQDDTEPASAASQADMMGPSPEILQQITPEMAAAGYQPGMTTQQITVGDEGKGPKIPMIIAAVFLVIGMLGIVIAGVAGASMEETLEGIETGPYTSDLAPGEALTHTDDDNAGEMGWYLLIPGDPKADVNNNGIPDACDELGEVNITNADGDDIGERVATINCIKDWDYYDIKDHVVVGVICSTIMDQNDGTSSLNRCQIGEDIFVSNNNNVSMKILDQDAMFIPILGKIVGQGALMGTSFFGGCCSLCGGLIALIVGLMRLGGGKQNEHIQFQIQ
jgi:hypothetical protein